MVAARSGSWAVVLAVVVASGGAGAEEKPVRLRLEVIAGLETGGKLVVREGGTALVGRGKEMDLRIGEAAVSRKHLKISCVQKACTVEDLGSSNGTLLNGEKILKAVLKPGDKLAVGQETLLVSGP